METNPKDLKTELTESRKNLFDNKYKKRETVLSKTAYLDIIQTRRRNLYISYIGGFGLMMVPRFKNKIGMFFLGSFLSFSALDFVNDYNFQKICQQVNRRSCREYNMMMDVN